MKEKIKRFIKKNIVGFVIGFGVTIVIGVVSATTIASSSDLTYSTSMDNSITNVQQALDALYSVKPEIVHYAVGDPTTSDTTDYTSLVLAGHNNFVALYEDGTKAACVFRNGELGCFKNGVSNYIINKYKMQGFFSDVSCDILTNDYVDCQDDKFLCGIQPNGYVYCYDKVLNVNCRVTNGGTVICP